MKNTSPECYLCFLRLVFKVVLRQTGREGKEIPHIPLTCITIINSFFLKKKPINLFILIGGQLLYNIVVVFAIHRHESATGVIVSF